MMTRTLLKAIVLPAVTAGLLGVLCGPALAGSYELTACSPSSSPGLWTLTNTFPAALVAANACGGPALGATDGSHSGALYGEDVLGSSADIPDGSRAGWTFTAPAGTTITAISYYRSLRSFTSSDLISGLFLADGSSLEQCKIPWPFPSGSSIHCDKVNNQGPTTFSGLSTTSLFFGVMCRIVDNALACIGGGTIHAAAADLYSARVTLSENSTPDVGAVGGALWQGDVVFGRLPVTFAASDPSGIKDQLVTSDSGRTLVSATQTCDFMTAPPCPQQPAGALSVDTTRVPDGPHTFSLTVTDAAANSQATTSPPVVVDNNGPPPPLGLTATTRAGSPNVIALAWHNPPDPPAPIARAMVQLCQGAACSTPAAIDATGSAELPAPARGDYGVRLWLLDTHGRGGPRNAALTSLSVPPSAGAPATARTRISAVLHGRHLHVTATITRTGRVRVSWSSRLGPRTIAHGSRSVAIHDHQLSTTFTLPRRARIGVIRVTVRSGRRVVARTRPRRG